MNNDNKRQHLHPRLRLYHLSDSSIVTVKTIKDSLLHNGARMRVDPDYNTVTLIVSEYGSIPATISVKTNPTRRSPWTITRTPCRNFFLRGGWGGRCPNYNFSKLLELSETSRTRKLIFGLHVNIDKKLVADITLPDKRHSRHVRVFSSRDESGILLFCTCGTTRLY